MMSNNKILTVSYGTFSCTLEGFDDSFGTMKAIAEYFRDLASDDRYFGAEPPQPDVEMLSRIAQKEISRRVEVREHEGKIVLSATDQASTKGAGAALAAPEPPKAPDTKADAMIEAEAVRAANAQAEAAAETARVQAEAKAKADAQEAARQEQSRLDAEKAEAERLEAERLEAEAEAERAEAERLKAERAEAERAEAERLEKERAEAEAESLAAKAEEEEQEAQNTRDLAAELPEADAFFAASTAELDDDDADNAATTVATETIAPVEVKSVQNDGIAAKLERIRAVVSNAGHASDEDSFTEDEHADDVLAKVSFDAKVEDNISDAFDIESFSIDDDVEADEVSDTPAISEADVTADQDEMDDDDMSSILARLEEKKLDEADDAELAEIDALEGEDTSEFDANILNDTLGNDDDFDIEDDTEEPRQIARVIKVKRADLDDAIAQGNVEEIEDYDDDFGALSDEDEAELAQDLAEVEDEDDAHLFGDDAFEDKAEGVADARPELGDNENDLSRLMAEADHKMADEEGRQSRDAFSHLRAAVAAKIADTDHVDPTAEEEEVDYRSDLATAVKPRRPTSGGGEKRPATSGRPAPLKLVAEQRVDFEDADKRGPIRPRRVALKEAASANVAGDFVEFAEEMGASELPDLLEAAAAYMSFVEGREQFSRPQLMNKVRSVEQENFSREDGLRHFGKLLRAGKIERIRGGRFTVTDDIGYRPDTRAAS